MDAGAGPFGAQLDTAEFNTGVKALPPAALLVQQIQPALPSRAVLTSLPAVAQQGTTASPGFPGSCEAQAFGYGLGSYTAARSSFGGLKWNPALPGRSVSAAYLYERQLGNQHEACGKGTTARNYLAQLVGFGAPTRASVPYYPDCTYLETIPGQADFPDDYPGMPSFRIGSYANFNVSQNPAAAVQLVKEFIANGQVVPFSGLVLCGYRRQVPLRLKDGVIYETSYILGADNKPAGHAQIVVGYDDDVGTPGDKGALLVQNSFGVN